MKAQFRMISGSRAGQTDILGQSQITIGRHPQAVLRFDPDQDLDVSSQHAVVTLVRDTWVLRDLGSTNGTFVNGKRLERARVAKAGDVIKVGSTELQVQA